MSNQQPVSSICSYCYEPVIGEYEEVGQSIYLKKVCRQHGTQRVLVSNDIAYSKEVAKSRALFAGRLNGRRTPLMAFLEVIDECDLACPTCIAGSTPGMGNARSKEHLVEVVRKYVSLNGKLNHLFITGGEPTLHPNLAEILRNLSEFASQIVLITNGVRISSELEYLKEISEACRNLHVYLQFDSLRAEALIHLRGRDYSAVRRNAIKNLDTISVGTTLVSVVKKGINDQDLEETVMLALKYKCVNGVTFQPIRAAGRHNTFLHEDHSLTLTDIRSRLTKALELEDSCLTPHPEDPDRVCIGYFSKSTFENLTRKAFDKFLNDKTPLYLLDEQLASLHQREDSIRVTIVSYYDQFDLVLDSNRANGMIFLESGGEVTSLETKFLPKIKEAF